MAPRLAPNGAARGAREHSSSIGPSLQGGYDSSSVGLTVPHYDLGAKRWLSRHAAKSLSTAASALEPSAAKVFHLHLHGVARSRSPRASAASQHWLE